MISATFDEAPVAADNEPLVFDGHGRISRVEKGTPDSFPVFLFRWAVYRRPQVVRLEG
jgi:hypothetical protein